MSHTSLASGVVRSDERVEIVLPSGARAQILKTWFGRHARLASRIAGPGAAFGGFEFGCAVIVVRAQVDGRPLTIEDLDEMWADDLQVLWGHCMGKGGAPSRQSISPSSESTEDSGPENSTE